MTEVFSYFPSKIPTRGILSIPHSGLTIPDDFNNYLIKDQQVLNQDVDFAVDQLVDIPKLQENGIHVLVSKIHRTAVDLNRAPEICVLNWKTNTHGIPLITSEPSTELIDYLRLKYYAPYYELMTNLIKDLEKRVHVASFIDLHSMPSKPTAYHMKQNPNQDPTRPDFCISDLNGKSCASDYIQFTNEEFQRANYNTKINSPYIGGYITKYVDQFNTNNIQIEINRALYMNEMAISLSNAQTISDFRNKLSTILVNIFTKFYKPIQGD